MMMAAAAILTPMVTQVELAVSWDALLALWAVAIANVGFGIAPDLPLTLSATAADILLGHVQ
mgnify:CR=1 FL=1